MKRNQQRIAELLAIAEARCLALKPVNCPLDPPRELTRAHPKFGIDEIGRRHEGRIARAEASELERLV
ncbi:MAG TPA: hypothetical protein VF203_15130 [Burkholderiales bacterium]